MRRTAGTWLFANFSRQCRKERTGTRESGPQKRESGISKLRMSQRRGIRPCVKVSREVMEGRIGSRGWLDAMDDEPHVAIFLGSLGAT